MCYCLTALMMPIVCTVQTVLRLITTIALAIEDILRLTIQTIHSWVSTILHTLGFIPLCFVFCFTQKCFCSQLCSTSCSPACYPMRSNCGCFLFLTMTLVFVFVYLFTDWWEDLFAALGLEFPCLSEKKTEVTKHQAVNKNNSEPMTVKLAHKKVLSTQKSVRRTQADKRHTTKSIKQIRKSTRNMKYEVQNELEVSYIDHFKEIEKENVSKIRSNDTNKTYVTVIVDAILEEDHHQDESLRKK